MINTSPPIPPFWDQIKAGCMVDSDFADAVEEGSCSLVSAPRTFPNPAIIVFSVGDVANFDHYTFSQSGVSITWSGGCSGSGNQCWVYGSCNASTCPALGSKSATATVRYGASVKVFNVSAYDGTITFGAIEN